ncbi:MAG: hypothetical protein WCR20_15805 [Verrucomicrobiota bacterium]
MHETYLAQPLVIHGANDGLTKFDFTADFWLVTSTNLSPDLISEQVSALREDLALPPATALQASVLRAAAGTHELMEYAL